MTAKGDEGCPKCGCSIVTIDGTTWRCEDQRSCGWEGKVLPEKDLMSIDSECTIQGQNHEYGSSEQVITYTDDYLTKKYSCSVCGKTIGEVYLCVSHEEID